MCPLYTSDVISNVTRSASNFRRNSTSVPVSELSYWGDFDRADVDEARTYYATQIAKAVSIRAALIADTSLTGKDITSKLFRVNLQEELHRSRLSGLLGKPYILQSISRLVQRDLRKWASNVDKVEAARHFGLMTMMKAAMAKIFNGTRKGSR